MTTTKGRYGSKILKLFVYFQSFFLQDTEPFGLQTVSPPRTGHAEFTHQLFRGRFGKLAAETHCFPFCGVRTWASSPQPIDQDGKDGVAFCYSLSSLQHLSYFDTEKNVPPPVFSSTLSSDDDENLVELIRAAPLSTTEVVQAKAPAAVVAVALALLFGIGGNYALDVYLQLSLLTAAPLLYVLGFTVGWQLMGGDQPIEPKEPAFDIVDGIKYVVDRPARLQSILKSLTERGSKLLVSQSSDERDVSKAHRYLKRAHTQRYLDDLRAATERAAEESRTSSKGEESSVIPFSPKSTRTYVDAHSYTAAIDAVQDWIDAVDIVLCEKMSGPAFALVRPPCHHACPTRGMGGCLLNSCAIAANYALEAYRNVRHVSILDIDAHHGNGIAACIQDRKRIRYCSIHEETKGREKTREPRSDNPRGPEAWDKGPAENCLNVPLKTGTTWENGYGNALKTVALPFLQEKRPDLLLVACGFDALEADKTSGLCLSIGDFVKIGVELSETFGNQVVFGLEGGYCWENGELGEAVIAITSPWEMEGV